ncbi:MAG: hypothetical protein R3286_20915, partial [Gammaproteobacteria bacterium]|nr:hypothetical protein [Gammaproteobacteria bacterium]
DEREAGAAEERDAGERKSSDRLERSQLEKRRAEPQRARESLQEAAPMMPEVTTTPAASDADRAAPAQLSGSAAEPSAVGAATGLADDARRADPQAWLRYIEDLVAAGDEQQALENLRAFRSRYPQHPLPASLAPLARALDAERP